jgi:hypothetical protein
MISSRKVFAIHLNNLLIITPYDNLSMVVNRLNYLQARFQN